MVYIRGLQQWNISEVYSNGIYQRCVMGVYQRSAAVLYFRGRDRSKRPNQISYMSCLCAVSVWEGIVCILSSCVISLCISLSWEW